MTEFWFDTQAGKMIAGEAAYEEAVMQSLPGDILPLPELLIASDFPYRPGDFIEKGTYQAWSTEDKKSLGGWALRLLETAAGEPVMLKSEPHIERLHILGLAPSTKAFKEFGSFSAYRELIGSPIEMRGEYGIYANWSLKDFVDYARAVERRLGRKPEEADYKSVSGPTQNMIRRRVGGVRKLNEYLGYPNIHEWDKDDYISWGSKVIAANGIEKFTPTMVRVLSGRKRGPGMRTVITHFTKWALYKEQAIEAYEYEKEDIAAMHQYKMDRYKQMLEFGSLPAELGKLSEGELLQKAARYLVAQDCIPSLTEYNKKLLAESSFSLIQALRRLRAELTAGQIEMVAVSQGVFDDLWPIDPGLEFLEASEDELAAERAKKAIINRRANANRRARLKNAA